MNSRTGRLSFKPFHLRHIEFGPHFDRELERHRAFFGHFDGFEIEIGFADRREALLFADLLQAIEQQGALHLIGDFIAEAMLDDLPRRAADPEARHGGRRHHFAERIVEVPIDVVARDRHRHVPFARAGARHLHVEIQRLIGRFFAFAFDRHAAESSYLVNFFVFGPLAGHVPGHPQKMR